MVLLWAPTMTFSSTVSRGNSARFWKVLAIPSLAMPGGHLQELLVLEVDPAAGRLVDRDTTLKSVVLPAPLGDQAADLAPLDGEGELVEGHDAAEADAHVTHVENRQRLTIPHAKSAASKRAEAFRDLRDDVGRDDHALPRSELQAVIGDCGGVCGREQDLADHVDPLDDAREVESDDRPRPPRKTDTVR